MWGSGKGAARTGEWTQEQAPSASPAGEVRGANAIAPDYSR